MKRVRQLVTAALCASALQLIGCGGGSAVASLHNAGGEHPRPRSVQGQKIQQCLEPPAQAGIELELIDDVGVVRLEAPAFAQLEPRQRVLAYWLSRAAVAGDAIVYDQRSRFGLRIKNLAEALALHESAIDAPSRPRALQFVSKVFINKGIYDAWTGKKYTPALSFEELRAAARAALAAGASIDGVTNEQDLDALLASLRPVLFDPSFEPTLTSKNPAPGKDIVTASASTYYQGLTLADLEGYQEKHPLNSRVVGQGGRITEQVYRSGRAAPSAVAAGLYAASIAKMVEALREAVPYAGEAQARALQHLISYFETGEAGAFESYNKLWVKDDSPVDVVLGFIETYGDPRGVHGEYEGAVFMVDPARTQMMHKLAGEARYFEARMPWAEQYRRSTFEPPTANAVLPLTLAGAAGPVAPAGINLPNDPQLRQTVGSKSFYLTSVADAAASIYVNAAATAFAFDAQQAAEIRRCGPAVWAAKVALHEVIGHGSGKVRQDLQANARRLLREYGSTIEEARADLVALHAMSDPRVVEIGLLPDARCADVAAQLMPISYFLRLRTMPEGEVIEQDHVRAQSLIVRFAVEGGALREERRDGEVHLVVQDQAAWRKAVADLLAEVMRIKAEGDYAAAKQLVERSATRVVGAWRDSAVRRARTAGLPRHFAFISPRIKALRDAQGRVIDATLVESLTLIDTALVDAERMELP